MWMDAAARLVRVRQAAAGVVGMNTRVSENARSVPLRCFALLLAHRAAPLPGAPGCLPRCAQHPRLLPSSSAAYTIADMAR